MKARALDVVLALLGSGDGVDGAEVARRLADSGRPASASDILACLLMLEESGHVRVVRTAGYRFSLTELGRTAAYTLGPGAPEDAVLVMGDIVGFVAFTSRQGDVAAHDLAQRLLSAAVTELTAVGGRLVKSLGDGFLGVVPTAVDAVAVVRRIAAAYGASPGPGGVPPLRAAIHRGSPIRHGGDLYGTDVNLVARLCEHAAGNEVVVSVAAAGDGGATTTLDVRGFDQPVAAARARLA